MKAKKLKISFIFSILLIYYIFLSKNEIKSLNFASSWDTTWQLSKLLLEKDFKILHKIEIS